MRILACVLSMVLAGCVVSVQPVVTAAASTFDARLVGHWAATDGRDRVVVTRGAANTYEIQYTDGDGKVGHFEAHLGRLGQRSVLDVQPAPRESSPMPEAASLIRGHVLYAIVVHADSVRVALLDSKALRQGIATKAVATGRFDDHDQLVLTGSTGELNRVLGTWIERAGALDEPSTWLRLKEVSQEDEVMAELGVMRAAAATGDWEALKRFFPAGSKWAEQAEAWVKTSESMSVGFFERSAQNKVSEILLKSPGRDTMDILVPYSVNGDPDANYAARLVRGRSGWVMVCSMESHGRPIAKPGCAGASATLYP